MRRLLVPVLAVITSLVIGGIIILLSGGDPIAGYTGLWRGAFGETNSIIETLIKTAPYIFAGLAVAVGFRGGLFNIGVEGQLFVGSIAAVIAGHAVSLPAPLHVIFALACGALGGAIWAAIPGYLKARTGAHEVITTIMTNYIALRLINWAISREGPLRDPRNPLPETFRVLDTARLPVLIEDSRLHIGVILAVLAAFVVYWLIWRTPLGFEIRTVGLSHSAARYAGINVRRTVVLTMAFSGALAGLGGAVQVLGLKGFFTTGFNVGLGFDLDCGRDARRKPAFWGDAERAALRHAGRRRGHHAVAYTGSARHRRHHPGTHVDVRRGAAADARTLPAAPAGRRGGSRLDQRELGQREGMTCLTSASSSACSR
ncbi:MAG: ABC transporter permease [Anaerolineae bacterium]|nr:ABC transporter permease [Anaerolineae bacterium]